MGRRYFFLLPAILAATAIFISCTDFFSTSWAPWAVRDPDKMIPTVTADNVDELIAMAENNPDLSLALLKKIQAAAAKASGADRIKLQGAALQTAVNAAGLGQAVLNAAGELTSVDSIDGGRQLVMDALNSMKNLDDSCSVLPSILPDPSDTEAFDAFTESADIDDLALTAALLIAGEANKHESPDDYVDSFDSNRPQSPNEELAVKMIEAVQARQDELSGSLEDVLKGLNLL